MTQHERNRRTIDVLTSDDWKLQLRTLAHKVDAPNAGGQEETLTTAHDSRYGIDIDSPGLLQNVRRSRFASSVLKEETSYGGGSPTEGGRTRKRVYSEEQVEEIKARSLKKYSNMWNKQCSNPCWTIFVGKHTTS